MDGGTKRSFWTSTAAIFTGIGTLLAGLVAVGTFAVSQHWFSGTEKVDDPVAIGTNGQPLPKLDEVVLFGPDKSILLEGYVDFDTNPPDRNGSGSDTFILFDKLTSAYGMVRWKAAKKPSQNECSSLLATLGSGTEDFAFEVGDRFCVRTNQARIAYFQVVSETSTGWEISVTSWKQRTDKN